MDIFQTTVTAVTLAVSVSEFIRRYRNAPEDVRRTLASIEGDCRLLKLVDDTLREREALLIRQQGHSGNVVSEMDVLLKSCANTLGSIKELLTRAENIDRVSLDRAKLVLRSKDLLGMQTELSIRVQSI